MTKVPSLLARSWILLPLVGTAIEALIAQPLRVPPAPQSMTIEVEEGGTISIPLRAGTRSGYRLNFLIRSAPERGLIKEIRRDRRLECGGDLSARQQERTGSG